MREIKFRAWDYEARRMLYSASLAPRISEAIYGWDKNGDATSLKLMQYTGLKDKNGKEIYEGDIVVFSIGNPEPILKREVKWDDDGYWYPICTEVIENFDYDLFEVIGNLYENSELLTNAN